MFFILVIDSLTDISHLFRFFFCSFIFQLKETMSVAELTVVILKEPGTTCGFTLIKNSCTINRIVDQAIIGDQLRPGDLILHINDVDVDEETIRDVLRNCRDLSEVQVTIARSSFHARRFYEQNRILGMNSPKAKRTGFFACLPRIFGNGKKKDQNVSQRRQSSSNGDYSPQGFGSVASVSSAGMRPVDLRKLHKEGAGSMWKASRESSIR